MNYDRIKEGGWDTLFICEGPFDFLKIDYYAQKENN